CRPPSPARSSPPCWRAGPSRSPGRCPSSPSAPRSSPPWTCDR
ncbi:MAG: hypothetical protein AVDCRST_MAG48-3822, partial [uncultured Friedmanniella sp.]